LQVEVQKLLQRMPCPGKNLSALARAVDPISIHAAARSASARAPA
jgi:hypothetical protein